MTCASCYRAGVDDAGPGAGVEFTHLIRCGWSQDLSLPVADRAMLHADNCYFLPAVRIESHRLKTNTQSATAFRGFGGPQGMVGIERVMDHVAFALGRDPLEVRRVNFYRGMPGRASRPPDPPRDISTENDRRCRPRPIRCRWRISSGMSWWRSWRNRADYRRAAGGDCGVERGQARC